MVSSMTLMEIINYIKLMKGRASTIKIADIFDYSEREVNDLIGYLNEEDMVNADLKKGYFYSIEIRDGGENKGAVI